MKNEENKRKLTAPEMKEVSTDSDRSGSDINFITCPNGVRMACPEGQIMAGLTFGKDVVGDYHELIGFSCMKPRDPDDSGSIQFNDHLCPGYVNSDVFEPSGTSGLIPDTAVNACKGKKEKDGCVYQGESGLEFGTCQKQFGQSGLRCNSGMINKL